MRKILKATLNKDLDFEGSNEDHMLLDMRNNRMLMVDGASESFAARRWARILVEEWRRDKPALGISFIEKAQDKYSKTKIDVSLDWARAAAARRGSFCTFLEIIYSDEKSLLSVRAVGDTCAILVSESGRRVWSFPIDRNEEFNSSPKAISTHVGLNPQHHEDLLIGSFAINWKRLGATHLIMATDAVAHWLITDDEDVECVRVREVLALKNSLEFKELVLRERDSRNIHLDDSSIAVFDLMQSET